MSLLYMYQKLKWKATVSEFYGEIKFVKEFEYNEFKGYFC